MILVLDVGNSQILGGVYKDFDQSSLQMKFRMSSQSSQTSDEHGIFLKSILADKGLHPKDLTHVAITTVVPKLTYSLTAACLKYLDKKPLIIGPGIKTGLQIKVKNPLEVGADRVANCIAAAHLYPDKNKVIIDLGTATTFDVLTVNKEYLGGSIMPGLRLCNEALEEKTAKLSAVEIIPDPPVMGKNTFESIQSGLYYMHLGAMRLIVQNIKESTDSEVLVLGTGGFSQLFAGAKLFDHIEPDLVLLGTLFACGRNL